MPGSRSTKRTRIDQRLFRLFASGGAASQRAGRLFGEARWYSPQLSYFPTVAAKKNGVVRPRLKNYASELGQVGTQLSEDASCC